MSVFAERLKILRDNRGQTQDEVGKAVGKSREAVSKYEIGEREPDVIGIASLARHFNVSSDYMLGITDDSELLIGNKQSPFSPELYAFEKYLNNERFIPYLRLSVKAFDNSIELDKFNKIVTNIIKQSKKQSHP